MAPGSLAGPPAGPDLADWPIARPSDEMKRVNRPMTGPEEDAMRRSIRRGQPLGQPGWQSETATRLDMEMSLRPLGRPRKPKNGR